MPALFATPAGLEPIRTCRRPLLPTALSLFLCAGQALAAAPVAKLTVVRAVVAGQSVSAKLLASDADGDPLTYTLVSQPASGTVTLNDAHTGAFTYNVPYSADPALARRDTFTFKVNDGALDSAVQTAFVTVLPRGNKVVAAGDNGSGQLNVGGWRDVVAVSAGYYHTVGLKADGTVMAAGDNSRAQLNVGGWGDVVAVAAGQYHTVGLKADGAVLAVGNNNNDQLNVSGWSNVVAVVAGERHTVGLKADGTVVAVGDDAYGQSTWVRDWSSVLAVSAGFGHTVGLKVDGTLAGAGSIDWGQLNVGGWNNMAAVAAGRFHTVGLEADRTVVAVGDNAYGQLEVSGWGDVAAVSAGERHTVGLQADGTVVAAGSNGYGQLSVTGWSNVVAVAAGLVHTVGLSANAAPTASAVTLYAEPSLAATTPNLLPLASDADGDTLTIGGKSDGAHGTVTDNGDGTLSYTAADGFTGNDSFTYAVSDGITSTSATVTVQVSTDWDGDGITNADEYADGTNPLAATTAKPRFSAAAGRYRDRVRVTIESPTAGATLRYTLDGTDPSPANGTEAAGGTVVEITRDGRLKAMAFKTGLDDSAIASADYVITHKKGGGGSFGLAGIGALLLFVARRREFAAMRP